MCVELSVILVFDEVADNIKLRIDNFPSKFRELFTEDVKSSWLSWQECETELISWQERNKKFSPNFQVCWERFSNCSLTYLTCFMMSKRQPLPSIADLPDIIKSFKWITQVILSQTASKNDSKHDINCSLCQRRCCHCD